MKCSPCYYKEVDQYFDINIAQASVTDIILRF